MSGSLSRRVAREYYLTTSSRGHRPTERYYASAAQGLRRRFRSWLPADRNARCLDLGCGCGEMLYLLEHEGFRHTTGVDMDVLQLQHARAQVSSRLIACDAIDFIGQCKSGSYDLVSAVNFLEHLSKDKLLELLTHTSRVLADGGSLIAMVPNALSPFGSLTRHWDITHEWAFTPNNFRQLAAIVGFEQDVDIHECGPVPHGLMSVIRYAAWQLIRAGVATWMLVEIGSTRDRVYTMDMLVRFRKARA